MAAAIFFSTYYRFCFCLPHYTGSTGKEQGFAAPLRALALSRLRPFIMGVKKKSSWQAAKGGTKKPATLSTDIIWRYVK
jgi:hypothetical protein